MLAALRDLEAKRKLGLIQDDDAALVKEYILQLQAERGMTSQGLLSECKMVTIWAKCLHFTTMTTADIMEAKLRMDARNLKQNTMRGYLYRLVRFSWWCAEEKWFDIDVEKLDRIRIPGIDWQTKTAGDMLTGEEVKQIIDHCRHPRDQALFSILYEGGFRPVEIVRLTWGQVKFDRYGVVVNTAEKTGKPRYIRLIASKEYFARWRVMTPGPKGNDDPVFVSIHRPHTPLKYGLMQYQLKAAVRRAGIKKVVSLYLFRHSRITHMIEQEIPESVIQFGSKIIYTPSIIIIIVTGAK